MFPRLFEIGGFSVPTYGLLVASAFLVGLFIATRLARRSGINEDDAWNLGVVAVLSAIVGAKLLLLVTDWEFYSQHPQQFFSLGTLQAGGVFYGGLLGAIAACTWYMRRRGMPGMRTADAFAPGIALGHGVGRLGCFAAGCCYGSPTDAPWGVTFTDPLANLWVGTPLGVRLHPTQLYELVVGVLNFFVLLWLFRRKTFDGQVLGAYLFLYGFARYFIEFFRGDPERGTVFGGALTITQLISIGLVIAGAYIWLRRGHLLARVESSGRAG